MSFKLFDVIDCTKDLVSDGIVIFDKLIEMLLDRLFLIVVILIQSFLDVVPIVVDSIEYAIAIDAAGSILPALDFHRFDLHTSHVNSYMSLV